ncbi:MAG: winged helix-turn-helix transcriptional regulator [Bacteroidales bacterium]|nr:winged helix-turn-helix transcriptional regulator [Bacteroidales bacterium]
MAFPISIESLLFGKVVEWDRTDEHNLTFQAVLPIHQAFVDDEAYLASIGKEFADYSKVKVIQGAPSLKKKNVKNKQKSTKNPTKESSKNQLTLDIIRLMMENSKITQTQMAERLGKHRDTIAVYIKEMIKTGIVVRVGSPKFGHWVIN